MNPESGTEKKKLSYLRYLLHPKKVIIETMQPRYATTDNKVKQSLSYSVYLRVWFSTGYIDMSTVVRISHSGIRVPIFKCCSLIY
jgi:hypothetical protein